jgi:tryptophanase
VDSNDLDNSAFVWEGKPYIYRAIYKNKTAFSSTLPNSLKKDCAVNLAGMLSTGISQ